jgi:hypothetical protein
VTAVLQAAARVRAALWRAVGALAASAWQALRHAGASGRQPLPVLFIYDRSFCDSRMYILTQLSFAEVAESGQPRAACIRERGCDQCRTLQRAIASKPPETILAYSP